MTERLIKTIDFLLLFASACLFYGLLYFLTDEHRTKETAEIPQKTVIPRLVETELIPNPNLLDAYQLRSIYEYREHSYTAIEFDYIGIYFVTAYSSAELGGSTATASGEECEWHEEWYIPTTAAIDPKLHKFGEILMIEGKLYRCADTGADIKNRWIDCYVPDMESVWNWNTGYKEVFSVRYEQHIISAREGRLIHEWINDCLLSWSGCNRVPYRSGCRVDD